MKKKFTMLFASLFLFLGTIVAQSFDELKVLRPVVSPSTGEGFHYYIRNVRNNDYYVTTTNKLGGGAQQLGASNSFDDDFEDEKEKVVFKLLENGKIVSVNTTPTLYLGYTDANEGGNKVQLFANDNNYTWTLEQHGNGGYAIIPGTSGNSCNMYGHAGANIGLYTKTDGGGNWVFEPANDNAKNLVVEVTYKYALGGVVLKTATKKHYLGDPYSAPAIGFVTFTYPDNNPISATNNVVTVTCTVDNLPFETADSYETVEHWYYMTIHQNSPKYLYYDNTVSYIKADKVDVDKNNKDLYSWGFIGNPIVGISIVNKAAGETMVLSSPEAPTENINAAQLARMVAKDGATGNLVWHIFKPTYGGVAEGAFYMQHPTAEKYAFNLQSYNNVSSLCYWDGRNDGSALQVVERPAGVVAEHDALIEKAKELKEKVVANIGTHIGEYSQTAADALATAIATAEAIDEASVTAGAVDALQQAMYAAVLSSLPKDGKYYLITSSLAAFPETKAVYSNGDVPSWKTLIDGDASFYWVAVATNDGAVVLKNAKTGKYLVGKSGDSQVWTTADNYTDDSKLSIKVFSKDDNAKGYEYGLIMCNKEMHAAGHISGSGKEGTIVSWNETRANTPSSWFIQEVEQPEFFDVTYNFVYGGDVKYSTTHSVKDGTAYPAVVVPALPYGVVAENVTTPEGTVTENFEKEFTLTVTKNLPFAAAADVNSINTWYYARMQTNQPGYIGDIADDSSINVAWGKSSDVWNENFVWGFAGNIWDGITVVNKGTGKQLTSTGGGNVTLTADGTPFFVVATSETTANAANGFCLRKDANSDCVNANYGAGKLSHWSKTDAGSTMFLTEYVENEIAVSDVDWATMYLDYAAYIPEGVKAYTVTGVEDGYVTLTQLEGVIPANTGVILENEGDFTFKMAAKDVAAAQGNLLQGSVENSYVEGPAYVLANKNDKVGLYKAKLDKDAEGNAGDTHFLNNAGKAYLVLPAAESAPAMFSFGRGQGTTGIEDVELTIDNVVIYDITGRRVEKMEKGIYIVNGKKVFVK